MVKTLLVLLSALAAPAAGGEAIDIAWTPTGDFERTLVVATGKFVEICGPLERGRAVRWSFTTDRRLHFNIHYHVGKDVVYPARWDDASMASGTLEVSVPQTYCWMWSSKQKESADLRVTLKRER